MGNSFTHEPPREPPREPPPQRTVQDIQNEIQAGRQRKFNEIMDKISVYVAFTGRNYGYLNYKMSDIQDAEFAVLLLQEAGFQVENPVKEGPYDICKNIGRGIGINMSKTDIGPSCSFYYVKFSLEIENPQPLELPPAYNQVVNKE